MLNDLQPIAQAIADAGGRALVVGGFVRDHLMGRNSKDMDVEVFGIQPDALRTILESFGRVDCVGESFGVYKLGEFDFSIPRRDSKTGDGHKGFTITGDPTMTVEDAARRRDFTINAIYVDPLTGEYIDPFNGRDDIKGKWLRVVDAERFADDSLRVLRGIQFAARFGFEMDFPTWELCKSIDLSDLPSERVWGEFEKLLRADDPMWGFHNALHLGVVDKLWPELKAMVDVEQDPEWHPEGNVWIHTLFVVDAMRKILNAEPAASKAEEMTLMLAALCHDLGKPSTTEMIDGRWRALGHEEAGVAPTTALLDRLNVHTIDGYDVRKQVLALVEHHLAPLAWFKDQPRNSSFRRLSLKVDLNLLATVAEADITGRPPKVPDLTPIQWFRDKVKTLDLREGPPPAILMGRHLIEMGVKPGVRMGEILKQVFEMQLEGTVTNLDDAWDATKTILASESDVDIDLTKK